MKKKDAMSNKIARLMVQLRNAVSLASWPAILLLSITAFLLGIWGFHENLVKVEDSKTFSLSTLILLSIQLFVLNSGIQPDPINWKLEIARYAALVCSASAFLKAGFLLFDARIRKAFFLKSIGHEIICGYGIKGQQIYSDLLDEGKFVCVVEASLANDDSDLIKLNGNMPIHGNATHEAILMEAGIIRASRIFIACGDDAANIKIATRIGSLLNIQQTFFTNKVQIHIHIRDSAAYTLLAESNIQPGPRANKFEFRRFDTWTNAARIHVRQWPPDFHPVRPDSMQRVKSVFMGWSLESEGILLQIARMCHLANGLKPLSVLAFNGAKTIFERLLFRFPGLPNIVDFQIIELNLFSPESRTFLAGLPEEANFLTSLYISADNDGDVFELGVTAKSALRGYDMPVFLRLNQKNGVHELLEQDSGLPILRFFGGTNPACKVLTIVQEDLDEMAKLVHSNYLAKREMDRQKYSGNEWIEKPADREWDRLPETYREDNRSNADHLEVKLRAVNCRMVQTENLNGCVPYSFSNDEIEILARMEHLRWCASKWLDGWKLGPRNDALKFHDNLVPYENLAESIKDYDRDTVRKIPEIYGFFGYQIIKIPDKIY